MNVYKAEGPVQRERLQARTVSSPRQGWPTGQMSGERNSAWHFETAGTFCCEADLYRQSSKGPPKRYTGETGAVMILFAGWLLNVPAAC